ncbi:MAG: btuB 9 [Firmicutes bacterium]|nr:btuB 9 [Bacillota bacterium]
MKKVFKKLVIPSAVVCLLSPFNLAMAEGSTEVSLDEVEVRSTTLADYLVTTEVITAEKIKEMGATNLAAAINAVPGLYVVHADKNARLVRIRGAATDQTKVYIDGMPVFPLSGIASNSASDLSTIPIDNIERIEIIKGPGPVQYGTDYKGGVILITTKKGQGAGQTSLHLAGGSHNSFDNYMSYSGSDKNISYYITAGKTQGDGYLNNSSFKKEYFNGKFVWDLDKDSTMTFSGYYMNTDRDIANGIDQVTGEETSSSVKWSGDTKVNGKYDVKNWKYKNFEQTSLALQYDKISSDRFKYNVKFYHVSDGNDLWVLNGNNAKLNVNTATNPLWYKSTWYAQGNGIEFTGDLKADRNNTVTFGAKYNQINWESYDILNSSESGTDKRAGYYIQDNMKLNDKTDLTFGVRYDEAKQSYSSYKDVESDATDPVVNITHKLNEKNTLRFSAGKSHVFVTAKQAAANLDLDEAIPTTEKAINYEIGWAHNFDNKSSLDIAVFANKITDRITRENKTDPYTNIAKTDIKGIELEYSRYISKRLKGFVNYTYQKAEDTDETGVKTRAENLPNYMVNYGVTYMVDKFQGSVIGHVYGNVQTDSTTYPKLDNYHTVDLELKYRENKNLEYFLHVNNLFDTEYWEKYDYPGEGINFMAGANIRL